MHDLIDIPSPSHLAATSPRVGLWRLCRAVGAVVDTAPRDGVPRRIAALLPDVLAIPGLLTPAQLTAPPDGYGRNPVYLCPRDRFSILAMVWPAGVVTPVHDHREWCAFGVYRGEIEETWYDPADTAPDCARAVVRQVRTLGAGTVGHLPVAPPNIHRIRNPTGEAAVSIHVYGGNCAAQGPNVDRFYTVES